MIKYHTQVARPCCYDYNLITAAPEYPESLLVEQFNQARFGCASAMMGLEVTGTSTDMVGPTASKVNHTENNAGSALLTDLHRDTGIAWGDMMMVTPYKENRRAIVSIRNNLATDTGDVYKGIRNLSVFTIDGAQGQQAKVVLTLLANDYTLGFVQDVARFTVLMTRAKAAMYFSYPRLKSTNRKHSERQFRKADRYLWSIKAHAVVDGASFPSVGNQSVVYRHREQNTAHIKRIKAGPDVEDIFPFIPAGEGNQDPVTQDDQAPVTQDDQAPVTQDDQAGSSGPTGGFNHTN